MCACVLSPLYLQLRVFLSEQLLVCSAQSALCISAAPTRRPVHIKWLWTDSSRNSAHTLLRKMSAIKINADAQYSVWAPLFFSSLLLSRLRNSSPGFLDVSVLCSVLCQDDLTLLQWCEVRALGGGPMTDVCVSIQVCFHCINSVIGVIVMLINEAAATQMFPDVTAWWLKLWPHNSSVCPTPLTDTQQNHDSLHRVSLMSVTSLMDLLLTSSWPWCASISPSDLFLCSVKRLPDSRPSTESISDEASVKQSITVSQLLCQVFQVCCRSLVFHTGPRGSNWRSRKAPSSQI